MRTGRISRRTFLKQAVAVVLTPALLSGPLRETSWLGNIPFHDNPFKVSEPPASLSHQRFRDDIGALMDEMDLGGYLRDFKDLMTQTAHSCVTDNGTWVIPSKAYGYYLYTRDSLWVSLALQDRNLASFLVTALVADQRQKSSGRVVTYLRRDNVLDDGAYRDDESTLTYVLHCLLSYRLGGQVPTAALALARNQILAQIKRGSYVTKGETRSGQFFGGDSQIGTCHYWADTYRPSGQRKATSEVISYNQGLLCVALQCLKEMGLAMDSNVQAQAESAYASTINPLDRLSLPLREGNTAADVSALAGEALSLYLFDRPILSDERVAATLGRFSTVRRRDGSFLGFKVISSFWGTYRPDNEFSGTPINLPGCYQNGASWFLYDILALYAGARHGITQAKEHFVQRLRAETAHSWASHEYIRTDDAYLGYAEPDRDGYGWNTFVLNLLP